MLHHLDTMNTNILTIILSFLSILHAVQSEGQIFCHEDFTNEQIIEISCSGKYLNDKNYWTTLNTTFFETQMMIRENNSLDERNIAFFVENNHVQTLQILPFMPTVVTLSFKNNLLVSGVDGTFQNLPHLKQLDLSHNSLKGKYLSKYFFRGKYNKSLPVEHLNLAANSIVELRNDLFTYLTNVVSLDLGQNPLTSISEKIMDAISRLPNLKSLSLAQTQLSYVPDVFFAKVSLRTLFLNGNHFTETPRGLRRSGHTLEYLNLNNNPIHEINSDSFVGLSNLRELHINGMDSLIAIREDSFSPLISLSILHCTFNPLLNFIHPKAFFGLKKNWNLKEVFLDNNNLRFLPEETFELKKINILSLRGNPWNCTCSLKWLYQYVKDREHSDPEANIGIRCKYPEKLFKRSLLYVEKMVQCEAKKSKHFNDRLTRAALFPLCIGAFAVFSLILYFCFKIIYQQFNSVDRHVGTGISTVTKYKRAEFRDNVETLNNGNE